MAKKRSLESEEQSQDLAAYQQPDATVESRSSANSAKKKVKGKSTGRRANSQKQSVVPDRAAPWTFPKQTLEETVAVAQAIEEKFAGKPTPAKDFVKAVGFHQPGDWRFQELMRSANLYGLIKWAGATKSVEGTKIGTDIVTPSSPSQRQAALREAFEKVETFKKVAEHYHGKRIPEDEFFSNTLIRQFDISRDRVDHFIRVFKDNLNYLKAFAVGPEVKVGPQLARNDNADEGEDRGQDRDSAGRSFLDTCFVLMPFGEWYDRYYKDVYIPATHEAGFEPVRADGLFSTGTVVEQIWEQIKRAKVLLADLSDKNANVFYELGLAHAIGKPVVLVTGCLDDVPFDLRHLRVVIYDVRVPNWGDLLKSGIATYLKAAKAEPEKSIPQPFRSLVSVAEVHNG